MKSELVSISDIYANPSNPRTIKDESFKKLVNSVKEFPKMLEIRPIVVDADGMILGGNKRFDACIAAKLTEVHIVRAETLTEEEQRRFIIADNVSFGDWDYDSLSGWDAAELEAWGLEAVILDNGAGEKDPFDDAGVLAKNQYGVIVMCGDEAAQEKTFNALSDLGYNCKIVVT